MAGPLQSASHLFTPANFRLGPNASLEEADALLQTAGKAKAEIVNGELVYMSPTGEDPIFAEGEIFVSLRAFIKQHKLPGKVVSDNAGFLVALPNRKSFSPDAAYYVGPRHGMKFFRGAPRFAVEVRSEYDYGPTAEREMGAKRADYFAAGTMVVWDVDLLAEDIVRVHRATAPDAPTFYRRGQTAEAEPAVPGWTMPVDDLFDTSAAQE